MFYCLFIVLLGNKSFSRFISQLNKFRTMQYLRKVLLNGYLMDSFSKTFIHTIFNNGSFKNSLSMKPGVLCYRNMLQIESDEIIVSKILVTQYFGIPVTLS